MDFLEQLAARRRFGMRPGLETIRSLCAALGDPQRRLGCVVHVAGTNGKGAVCAMLDACLRELPGVKVGRYTSPHLVKLNERFFLNGVPIGDEVLERQAAGIAKIVDAGITPLSNLTFFEALTAVAFLVYAEAETDCTILETGLGGRLDATNVCEPALTVITRIGLDHCDWLGDTLEKIAAEKGGIVKPGVPIVLAKNEPCVRAVIERIAAARGAPFLYAPDLASEDELPSGLSLAGAFNRENAVTALAALKVLSEKTDCFPDDAARTPRLRGLTRVVWPGRFQLAKGILVDGAHNPPAATALAAALSDRYPGVRMPLVAGFCGDKDVVATLRILAPFVSRGLAVRTNNPRSLSSEETAARMREAGIDAVAQSSLGAALAAVPFRDDGLPRALVCGSLFLAGEALVELGAYPWGGVRFDPAESLRNMI